MTSQTVSKNTTVLIMTHLQLESGDGDLGLSSRLEEVAPAHPCQTVLPTENQKDLTSGQANTSLGTNSLLAWGCRKGGGSQTSAQIYGKGEMGEVLAYIAQDLTLSKPAGNQSAFGGTMYRHKNYTYQNQPEYVMPVTQKVHRDEKLEFLPFANLNLHQNVESILLLSSLRILPFASLHWMMNGSLQGRKQMVWRQPQELCLLFRDWQESCVFRSCLSETVF